MHKKLEINLTKINGGCQSGRKLVTHDSKSDLPLTTNKAGTCVHLTLPLLAGSAKAAMIPLVKSCCHKGARIVLTPLFHKQVVLAEKALRNQEL